MNASSQPIDVRPYARRREEFIDGLVRELERDTGRQIEREPLEEAVYWAMLAYDGADCWKTEDSAADTLPELADGLKKLIPHLVRESNWMRLARDQVDAERTHDLAEQLSELAVRAREAHKPVRRGLTRDKGLYDAVGILRRYLVERLGVPFTAKWELLPDRAGKKNREPVSKAARFITSVMTFIDAKRLLELETVAKNIVREQRDAARRCQLTPAQTTPK